MNKKNFNLRKGFIAILLLLLVFCVGTKSIFAQISSNVDIPIAQFSPNFPDVGVNPNFLDIGINPDSKHYFKIIVWATLSGVLSAFIIFFVLTPTRKKQ